jgi:arsenate reductase
MDRKPKILFLSTGNSNRSQMAEGFLRDLAGNTVDVVSAGIDPGDISPLAVEVMKEAGVDISHQHPKNITESLKERFGYVITVSDMARERAPIFPFTPNLLHWSLEDPGIAEGSAEEKKTAFVRVRDEIREKVQTFFHDFTANNLTRTKAATA